MILLLRSGSLLVLAAGLVLLSCPVALAAAEEASGTGAAGAGAQPAEGSASTAPSAASPSTGPTLTVQPAPTPRVASPSAPQAPALPKVHVQHAQGTTRSTQPPRRRARPHATAPAIKAPSAPSAPRKGRSAPAPSVLTPPLPLAFSSSLAGIPTFFIESFRIPPFLLPIFQAAGTAYGIPWQVLAAINEVETDYGRDLSVSSAGAEGWMQFLPSSWAIYGVDATGDGFKDPYNPADAIFAAARYLRAAGAASDLRAAIFAYNHSQAYVESVLLRARLLGGTPGELLGALTGLTQGRFPVHAPSHFADGFQPAPNGSGSVPGTTIYSQPGAPVIAVQDGLITHIGRSPALGLYISLRDAYGNTYTYAQLGRLARYYPVLQPHEGGASIATHSSHQAPEPKPAGPASAGVQPRTQPLEETGAVGGFGAGAAQPSADAAAGSSSLPGVAAAPGSGGSLHPSAAATPTSRSGGASASSGGSSLPGGAPSSFRAGPNDVFLHPLRRGVRVIAGTVLGHLVAGTGSSSDTSGGEARMLFQIRPAGVGAPLIDPKPILDGWVQLENTSVYRAGGGAATPSPAAEPTPGRVLLESKQQLTDQVLASRAIGLQRCGRQDVQGGRVDRRVLATLEFLALSGLRPTTAGLPCAHPAAGPLPAGATQSAQAVDITAVNGVALAGNQGPGSIGERTIRQLLAFQGTLRPRQIIGLRRYPGEANSIARPDHYDRITISYLEPGAASGRIAGAFSAGVTPSQWVQLIARLGEIPNPVVRSGRSSAAIPDFAGSGTGAFDGNH